MSLNNLGATLSETGSKKEAPAPTQEAVDLYRGLADPETGNPAAYGPDLAMSLWAFGWVCDKTQAEIQPGLAAVTESIELHEMLAAAGDEACRSRIGAVRATYDSLLLATNAATSPPGQPSPGRTD